MRAMSLRIKREAEKSTREELPKKALSRGESQKGD